MACKPTDNGRDRGFTIFHCGELVQKCVPGSELTMDFSTEAIEENKTLQTMRMIIGTEDTYLLEEFTAKMATLKKNQKRTPLVMPAPTESWDPSNKLQMVLYLRTLTLKLVKSKR